MSQTTNGLCDGCSTWTAGLLKQADGQFLCQACLPSETFKEPTGTRIDGVERNRLSPRTFEIPSPEEKALVRPGVWVKVGVEDPEGYGERFWVEVEQVDGDLFAGRVDNNLEKTDLHGLDYNDRIAFESRHILNIHGPTRH